MRQRKLSRAFVLLAPPCLLLLGATSIWAQPITVTIQTEVVGNAGNAADTTGYGAVNYTYNMDKYDVTASQYAAFLNAVAKTDTYGLQLSHVGHQQWQSRNHPK